MKGASSSGPDVDAPAVSTTNLQYAPSNQSRCAKTKIFMRTSHLWSFTLQTELPSSLCPPIDCCVFFGCCGWRESSWRPRKHPNISFGCSAVENDRDSSIQQSTGAALTWICYDAGFKTVRYRPSIQWWINGLYHFVAGDGRVDEWEVPPRRILEYSLSSPPWSCSRAVESVAPAAAATPPKRSIDAKQCFDVAGVQFEEVLAMVDRPNHPRRWWRSIQHVFGHLGRSFEAQSGPQTKPLQLRIGNG
jgi:hypothetical protein